MESLREAFLQRDNSLHRLLICGAQRSLVSWMLFKVGHSMFGKEEQPSISSDASRSEVISKIDPNWDLDRLTLSCLLVTRWLLPPSEDWQSWDSRSFLFNACVAGVLDFIMVYNVQGFQSSAHLQFFDLWFHRCGIVTILEWSKKTFPLL